METSAIAANLIPGGNVGSAPASTKSAASILPVRASDSEPRASQRAEQPAVAQTGRALGIFRQELTLALYARFGLSLSARDTVYDAVRAALTSEDVAADTVAAASRLVAENPDVSTRALAGFRRNVQAAASFTQETVGNDGDIGELDVALGKLDDGLAELDREAARNVPSSVSVLSVETQLRQRSTIRIRTQEGDVVRLDLRRSDQLSAQDVAVSTENGFATLTEVTLASRSGLVLRVNGDLNEAEFAAIQNVFSQAESIANEFFAGDLATAFGLASDLSFNSEQLTQVNLRFSSQEISSATYTQIATAPPPPAIEAAPAVVPPATPSANDPEPVPAPVAAPPAAEPDVSDPDIVPIRGARPPYAGAPSIAPAPQPAPEAVPVAATTDVAESSVSAQTTSTSEPLGLQAIDLSDAPFLEFFSLLADFLASVAEGFEFEASRIESAFGVEAYQDASTFRYHYSESFKMQILKSVIEFIAPEESTGAAELAGALIDGLAEAAESERADA